MVLVIVLARMGTVAVNQTLLGCPSTCGSVPIPNPFGIGKSSETGDNCFLEGALELTCDDLYGRGTNDKILNITLDGKMDLLFNISHVCKRKLGNGLRTGTAFALKSQAFAISSEDNEFVTVGCDTYGYLHSFHNRTKSSTGCLTRCVSKESVESIQRHGIQIKHSALKISITPPTSTTAALPLLSKREPTISRWIIYATSPS